MLELSYEELDGYIQQICTAAKLVYVENKTGEEVPLLLRYPSKRDLQVAELVYRNTLKKAREDGLPTIEEMETIARDRRIFTDEDEEKMAKLRSRIEGQKAILSKTTRVPARRERLKEVINNLEVEIENIRLKKEPFLEMTQERKASEEKYLYLTSRGVYNPMSLDLFWPSDDDFQQEPDFILRQRAFLQYIILAHGLRQDVIRYIARSNLWRIRYVTALKTSDSLFGCPISDFTVDQTTLLYWSHYYQSIYEMLTDERPPDTIIEDDQALDAYMKDWQEDRNRDAAASKAKKNKHYGASSAWDHGETLVMKSNPMHQDIEYSKTLTERSRGSKTMDAAPLGRNSKKSSPLVKKG